MDRRRVSVGTVGIELQIANRMDIGTLTLETDFTEDCSLLSLLGTTAVVDGLLKERILQLVKNKYVSLVNSHYPIGPFVERNIKNG